MGYEMTKNTFKEAEKILKKIENIELLKRWAYNSPMIKKSREDSEYMFLSWVDNEYRGLENTIIDWCNKEIKRLQDMFEKL